MVFTQEVREPPASAFPGRVYETVAARCAACEMSGGDEPPCRPAGILAEYERLRGQPCPRVELEPANNQAAELLSDLLDERIRPIALWRFRARTSWMTDEERTQVSDRAVRALRSQSVSDALYPDAAKARAKQSREKRS